MLNKILYVLGCSLFCLSFASFAATPKDINYAGKGSSFGGGKYYIYNVRCSDGSTKIISAWDERENWCVGKKKNNCSKDQLQAAKKSCN